MEVENKKRTSAHERLSGLPDFFSINTLIRLTGLDRKTAKVSLSKWKKRGLIDSFGGNTGLYFNTYNNKQAKDLYWYKALRQIYPEAVYAGVEPIRQAGWMTQIPQQQEVIIRNRDSYHNIDEINFMPRSIYWFRRYKDGVVEQGVKRTLTPEFALVDLCEQGKYIPDPDDLFLDEEEVIIIKEAFEKLKVDIPSKLWEVLEYEGGANQIRTKRAMPKLKR